MPKTFNTAEAVCFIACPGQPYIWAAYTDQESAAADLPDVLSAHPDQPYAILTDFQAFAEAAEAAFMTPAREISADEWNDALGCLPPLQWHQRNGVELFSMSEFTFGNITEQFASYRGRYLRKPVKFRDVSTYITPAHFAVVQA